MYHVGVGTCSSPELSRSEGATDQGGKMKKLIVAVLVVLSLVVYVRWCNRPDNGIHAIGKNSVLIEGECITINWDATEAEADAALRKWKELKV